MLADLDHFGKNYKEEEERQRNKKPWQLTWPQIKLVMLAGVGFFLDAYDLFIINQVAPMLAAVYYPKTGLPNRWQDLIKAASNIGCVVGQISFGLLGDAFGRSAVYGKELILIIIATIMTISVPSYFSGHSVLVWIFVWRIVLGVGVGGDYPMSATVVSDRANIHRRGTMLCFIFANQGWGSFVGSIVTIVTLSGFKSDIRSGHPQHIDKIWRVIIGLSLVPAFAVLYQRLTLPESRKFTLTKESQDTLTAGDHQKDADHKDKDLESNDSPRVEPADAHEGTERYGVVPSKKASWQDFLHYMKEWSHLRVFLGTMLGWFFVDIDIIGRKWLQFGGFLMAGLFLAILAGEINHIGKGPLVAVFTFLQFFFNFGANTTTFIVAAESFPTRIRATAHGISAAAGKCGAILSSLVFNQLKASIGTSNVLWIFFATSMAGAVVTLLLDETMGVDPDEKDEAERRAKGEL